MTRCTCATYEQIGVGVPVVHALHMAAESQAKCPVHRGCEHRSGAGMCANCQPAMFPTAAEIEAGSRWIEAWRELPPIRYVPVDHGAPQQEAEATGRRGAPCTSAIQAPAATPPEPDRTAWQELTRNQLAMLDTFASLAQDGVDEVHADELVRMFVESAADIGVQSWTRGEVYQALLDLQKLGYAGVTEIGGDTWAIGNRGRYVAEDYRRRKAVA